MTNDEIMNAVKPAICAKLKSPTSAQFPMDTVTVSGDEQNGYQVDGFVDSQNSYGAMIRTDYTARVVLQNGTPVVIQSSVGTKAAKNYATNYAVNYVKYLIIFGIIGFVFYLIFTLLI